MKLMNPILVDWN